MNNYIYCCEITKLTHPRGKNEMAAIVFVHLTQYLPNKNFYKSFCGINRHIEKSRTSMAFLK